jgi:hypothetical protein
MDSRLKNTIQNLGLLGVGLLLALALAEVGARLFAPEYLTAPHPRGMYIPKPARGYALAPNFTAPLGGAEFQTHISTNSYGLRERELGPKSPGSFRILVLGDSFAFGQGVDAESTFPRLLETELLAVRPEVEWQTVNAGTPGYGTDQELALLEEVGWAYEPDLVIVAFFVGNDIDDNSIGGMSRRSVRSGYLYDEYRAHQKAIQSPVVGPITSYLALHSRLYVLLRSVFDTVQWARGVRVPVPPEHLDPLQTSPPTRFVNGLALTETLLVEMADQAAQHQAGFVVVLIPSAVQVDSELWEKTLTLYGLSVSDYELQRPSQWAGRFSQRTGVRILDLLPALQTAGESVPLYFETDTHWNANGHKVAAKEIGRYLTEEFLLLDPF